MLLEAGRLAAQGGAGVLLEERRLAAPVGLAAELAAHRFRAQACLRREGRVHGQDAIVERGALLVEDQLVQGHAFGQVLEERAVALLTLAHVRQGHLEPVVLQTVLGQQRDRAGEVGEERQIGCQRRLVVRLQDKSALDLASGLHGDGHATGDGGYVASRRGLSQMDGAASDPRDVRQRRSQELGDALRRRQHREHRHRIEQLAEHAGVDAAIGAPPVRLVLSDRQCRPAGSPPAA